ncbi:MAG: hypothetical protein IJ326_09250 [Lachnospiraceae bacterium]|nr:hypothetical protein [Lachnospiraceae bacterium]
MLQNKWMRTITAVGLTGAVLVLMIIFFFLPKQEYSEKENRYLATFPEWNWTDVRSGEYMGDVTDYLSDHFPFRDFFMGLKTDAEMAMGKQEINEVYIAEDDYLIEAYQTPANTERIVETLKNFYEKLDTEKLEVNLMLVPTASYVHADKLPQFAPSLSQMETAEIIYEQTGIPAIDCSDRLLEQADTDRLFYKTDHHWTTYGAYQGYLEYCEVKGLTPVALEDLSAETVTTEFYGTIYSKVNDYSRKGDEITIYTNPTDDLTVRYIDTEETSDSLYNMEYLEKKDKYSMFLDNLHTLIEITNENAESEDVLVLIKDSYANSMVPFLTTHYQKIYVFDTRYYKQGPSKFIDEHPEVTDVLLLYNMNTLDTDTGIRGIY